MSPRRLVSVLLTTLMALTLPVGRPPALAAATRWHVSFSMRCDNTPENESACTTLWGDSMPVFGVATTRWVWSESDVLTLETHGQFVEHGTARMTERVPHLGPLCDARIWDHGFTGTCRLVYTGYVVIKPGKTGLRDFWGACGTSATTTTYYGAGHVKKEKELCNVITTLRADTLFPAQSGSWNTKQYAALLKLKSVPPGVTVRLAVSRQG